MSNTKNYNQSKIMLAEVPMATCEDSEELELALVQIERDVPLEEFMEDPFDSEMYDGLPDVPEYRYLSPDILSALGITGNDNSKSEEQDGPQMGE